MKTRLFPILYIILILLSSPLISAINEPLNSLDEPIQDQSLFVRVENKDPVLELLMDTNTNKVVEDLDDSFIMDQTFTISIEDLQIQSSNGIFSASLDDSSLFNQPGLPLIPMRSIIIDLPKNVTVQQVMVRDISLLKSTIMITYDQTPMPHFWSVNETPLHQHSDEIVNNAIMESYQKTLYPGVTHSYILGRNTTNTRILIHLFPIQYHFDTKETYVIDKGTISIRYTMDPSVENQYASDPIKNIIITHPLFYIPAKKLQQFHTEQGTPTELVTTKWIDSNYEPSSYPPVIGYKDFAPSDQMRKYDDELARKIITYLQTQSTNPDLEFVTIIGNAIHVPPSYYFGYNYYPVPTDFYFSSPDLDLIPNYRVGRLPVHTILEASRTINKIINWEPTKNQMENVAIAGGIPFNSPFFIGELITVDSVNQGFFDGLTVDKLYRTDERFENTDILSALENDYGLLYVICHGNANLIAAEPGRISARNLMNMPKNNNAPILSCIACSSGSYDTHIIKQGYSLDRTSFGEGVVISKGGSIAYIGGSRTNDGFPLLTLNNGRVEISKETYMAGLLTYVNQAYKKNVDNLGDLNFFAYETYLENNDLTDFWNLYHYLDFVLLGDPALQLPERLFQQESYTHPVSQAEEPIRQMAFSSFYDEYNGTIPFHAIDEPTSYETQTNSPYINLKQIETGNYANVQVNVSTHTTQNQKLAVDITPFSGNLYLLRFETIDGKEDWMYYRSVRPVDDDFNDMTTGFGSTRWNSIQKAIDNSDINDPIYVFNGTYIESVIVDIPCFLEGENKTSTIIDGDGSDDVILISSDGVTLKGFTIEHCGKNPWNAAVSIQPKRSLDSLQIVIEDNNIINNKNCGIYIDTGIKRMSPTISILQNNILYNNFGIYIQDGPNFKEFVSNTISGNNFGMYIVKSEQDLIAANNIINNYIGLYLEDETKGEILSNNFIENSQHCQFTETRSTSLKYNFWDDWIGLRFKINLPIPKLINGFHDTSIPLRHQFKIDLHPAKDPYII